MSPFTIESAAVLANLPVTVAPLTERAMSPSRSAWVPPSGPRYWLPAQDDAIGDYHTFAGEGLVTFTLVSVVLHVACSRQKENHFYGLAIGLVVLSGAWTVGPVSGGAFNPAVTFGMQLVKCMAAGHCKELEFLWMYWLAQFCGASVAAVHFLYLHGSIRDPDRMLPGFEDTEGLLTLDESRLREYSVGPPQSPRAKLQSI